MNEVGKFLKKLWFCVGVGGEGRGEGKGWYYMIVFYQLIYKVNMQKKNDATPLVGT